ncbi:hypothetical protein M3Y98_00796500 [Aphelenchoides besseyi]|nr:hypothetical protein M3Y98_00796500 [Aphelenchoides besseyi]KAI6211994.1 hypothetical protein M3Y96_00493300 [Aphelenchoides besseyi]
MDEQTDRSSSSASDFELVRETENHRPEQASDDCWIKETLTFLQNIKSFSNSWLTVSLLVLLLSLTVEYKRVSDISELMSVQLKDLRRDYDQLKMHDTEQQLQILTELRALRNCERAEMIDEPKEVESKTVEPKTVESEPKAEHVETQIKEKTKPTVEPRSMDIQEATETKQIKEPKDEQKQSDDPNDLQCSRDCFIARNHRNSIKSFISSCYYVVSHPVAVSRSICLSICLFIWKWLTIPMILTLVAWLYLAILALINLINEQQRNNRGIDMISIIGYIILLILITIMTPDYNQLTIEFVEQLTF